MGVTRSIFQSSSAEWARPHYEGKIAPMRCSSVQLRTWRTPEPATEYIALMNHPGWTVGRSEICAHSNPGKRALMLWNSVD